MMSIEPSESIAAQSPALPKISIGFLSPMFRKCRALSCISFDE